MRHVFLRLFHFVKKKRTENKSRVNYGKVLINILHLIIQKYYVIAHSFFSDASIYSSSICSITDEF